MAKQQWEPKRERRARAREERKRQEREQARAQRRKRWTTGVSSVLGIGVVAAFVLVTLLGASPEAVGSMLAGDDVEAARDRAGCEVVASTPAGSPEHFDDGTDPSLILTGDVVPPTGAGHYAGTHPPVAADVGRQLDAMALGHNLEHGAVVVWYDPARVDVTASGLADWAEGLNGTGFESPVGGASVFVSPFEDPGISSGKAIAMRSWSLGVDCDTFDEAAASSFVIEAFGRRGGAPEGVPYPQDVLGYVPGEEPIPYVETQTGLVGDGAPSGDADTSADDAGDSGTAG